MGNEVLAVNMGVKIEYIPVQDEKSLEEAKILILEYAESLNIDLCFQNFQEEIESLPGKYDYPEGALILAKVNGEAAGCIALRKIKDDICEMKRLYVRNAYRKLGIGRSLVNMIINTAKERGYSFIRLDTLPEMKEAQYLYESFGFYDIEPYVYNPIKGTRYMELKLQDTF